MDNINKTERDLERTALEGLGYCDHEMTDGWAEWTGTMSCRHCSFMLNKSDTKTYKARLEHLMTEDEHE
jgi:hypothetical protein